MKPLLKIKSSDSIDIQVESIKNIVITRLEKIIKLIKKENFDTIYKMLRYSPAGDGWGLDNRYIDFKIVKEKIEDLYKKKFVYGYFRYNDIGEVLDLIKELRGVKNEL